jgi:hypothetical protein
MSKPSSRNKRTAKDYEELGRMLESIFESGYINRLQTYKMSFVKGVVAGFGGVVGATLVVAILLWALSLLHNVPFVNRITDNVRNTVQQSEMK